MKMKEKPTAKPKTQSTIHSANIEESWRRKPIWLEAEKPALRASAARKTKPKPFARNNQWRVVAEEEEELRISKENMTEETKLAQKMR